MQKSREGLDLPDVTYDEISKSGATCLALFTHCIGAAGGEGKEGRGRQFYKDDRSPGILFGGLVRPSPSCCNCCC